MIFKVEVNNVHLTRLAKSMGYNGAPGDFKAFVERWIVDRFKENVKAAIIQEQAELAAQQELPETDIAPAP